MKSLYLLRHAKSSWADPTVEDFHRSLNDRGRRACGRVAAYMVEHGIKPELVLCSAARRAEETVEGLAGALDPAAPIVFEETLYMAGADRLLVRLQAVPDDVGAVMLVGHNPGLEDLAGALAGDAHGAAARQMKEKYPTAALAVFTLAVDRWRDIGSGATSFDAFVRPRDLAD